MPKEVTAFRAEDGSLHEDKCAAATRDVELMVQASPLAENAPFARDLVVWLTRNSKMIREKLEAHAEACPIAPQEQASPQEPEGTHSSISQGTLICSQCGTPEGEPHPFRHISKYIPAGVYYSHEQSNFYASGTNAGMGEDFYQEWKDREAIFPRTADAAYTLATKPAARANRRPPAETEGDCS